MFDKSGQLQRVKLVQEYRASECYRVRLSNHLTVAGDQHLGFQIEEKRYRDRIWQYKGKLKFKRPLKFVKVADIPIDKIQNEKGFRAFSIPTAKALNFPHQTLPVPPFIFGYWFFTHQSRNKRMYFSKGNSEFLTEKFKGAGYKIIERGLHSNGERFFSVLPSIDSHLGFDIPHRIPNNYLLASSEQRLELLKGILYARSKSYSEKTNVFLFFTKHLAIATQIQFLVESLGFKASFRVGQRYSVSFKSKIQLVSNQVPHTRPIVHYARRYITKIEKIPEQLCVHIETEGADNSYLVGEGFIAVC